MCISCIPIYIRCISPRVRVCHRRRCCILAKYKHRYRGGWERQRAEKEANGSAFHFGLLAPIIDGWFYPLLIVLSFFQIIYRWFFGPVFFPLSHSLNSARITDAQCKFIRQVQCWANEENNKCWRLRNQCRLTWGPGKEGWLPRVHNAASQTTCGLTFVQNIFHWLLSK